MFWLAKLLRVTDPRSVSNTSLLGQCQAAPGNMDELSHRLQN
jgi:hypothetical protein